MLASLAKVGGGLFFRALPEKNKPLSPFFASEASNTYILKK
ncbi:MAG: hypothetical protein U5L45_01560 [Saprospiraceae bacterium]|nr:hypothetical protein [Saprospiraceae bacterium]